MSLSPAPMSLSPVAAEPLARRDLLLQAAIAGALAYDRHPATKAHLTAALDELARDAKALLDVVERAAR